MRVPVCGQAKSELHSFWGRIGLDPAAWPEALERYDRFLELIQARNAESGLVGPASVGDFYLKHVADSLAVMLAFGELLGAGPRVADVGCGAGMPGLILAVALPAVRLTAIESKGRKADFVSAAAEALGLARRVEVVARRSGELARDARYAAGFDVVTARAVAAADKLIRDCRRLIAPGGSAVFYKTPGGVGRELPLARREAARHKLIVEVSQVIDLPAGAGARQFIRIRNGYRR